VTAGTDRRLRVPRQAGARSVKGSIEAPDGRAEPATASQLGRLLLDAKFSIGQPRPGTVSRSGLVATARSSGCRLVTVTAPAGYGKSTFLTQWAATEDRAAAWVSLDRFDDDPATLLASLASAYCRAGLGSPDLVSDMRSRQDGSVLGRAAPRLAAELRASPVPFVLMLDDVHELLSPACHDVLGMVISAIPRGSQLAAASRSEQPHLPRLRATGDALEFGVADLALDAAGARQVFAHAQVSVTPELAAAAAERTEGWPAGLYLAALIAKESRSQVRPVTGDDRYVADYLYREALIGQPKAIQRFLRRSAVLDQLCGPLCEAVLGSSAAAAQLRRIEARGLFVAPLDRQRQWYRYHALYREFLLGELRRTEPGIIAALHRRAADWYESNGFPVLALEHLLETDDSDRSVRLTAQLARPAYLAGQSSTVRRWLAALGDANIACYPPLAVLASWDGVLTGEAAKAERWAAVVDAASFDGEPASGAASFDSARAQLRAGMCAGGPEQMMADADFAAAQEPAWSPWRDSALWTLAEAHLLAGQLDEARALFAEVSTAAAGMSNWQLIPVCESQLAWLAMDHGDWDEAAGRLELALGTIDAQGLDDYVFSLPAFAGAARLSLHHGDVKEARRRLAQAMQARPTATYLLPYLAVRLRLQLARVFLAIADVGPVHQLLREIDDILTQRPALGTLVEEVRDFRGALASSAASDSTGSVPLTPAELRLLPYLQTHLTADMIAKRLFISVHTVKTEVKSIYRKLGVSSRDDAVQKATALGLLGG
jgi:LuxR family transcriptional regulator, maltose regulon positive regulatory protein